MTSGPLGTVSVVTNVSKLFIEHTKGTLLGSAIARMDHLNLNKDPQDRVTQGNNMRKNRCHRCDNSEFLILQEKYEFPCPCCGCLYGSLPLPIPTIQPHRLLSPAVIDINQPLDKITAEIMARFLSNGMTVSQCSRQLGITRATVYAKIKKYNLLDRTVYESSTIQINEADCCGIRKSPKRK